MSWQHERSASPALFKRLIKQLGMSQAAAGRYLGVSERTVARYASGDAEVRTAEILLLRSLIHHGEKPVVPKWKSEVERYKDALAAQQ